MNSSDEICLVKLGVDVIALFFVILDVNVPVDIKISAQAGEREADFSRLSFLHGMRYISGCRGAQTSGRGGKSIFVDSLGDHVESHASHLHSDVGIIVAFTTLLKESEAIIDGVFI